MKKLILFLVRRKLGVRKYQAFRFVNQNAPMNWYMFGEKDILWKVEYHHNNTLQLLKRSNVSFNWLMDNNCKVSICDDQAFCRVLFDILAARQMIFE